MMSDARAIPMPTPICKPMMLNTAFTIPATSPITIMNTIGPPNPPVLGISRKKAAGDVMTLTAVHAIALKSISFVSSIHFLLSRFCLPSIMELTSYRLTFGKFPGLLFDPFMFLGIMRDAAQDEAFTVKENIQHRYEEMRVRGDARLYLCGKRPHLQDIPRLFALSALAPDELLFYHLHNLLHGLNGRIKDPVIFRLVIPALAVDGMNEARPLAVRLFRKPARRVLINLLPLHDQPDPRFQGSDHPNPVCKGNIF